MIKLNIQMFGGRGSSSSYGEEGVTTAGDGKKLPFYDKTSIYKGMSVEEFERRTRNKKNEYIGLYDDKGKIIIAGTSYNHGAVAIPTTHPDFKKANSLTHNHPYHGERQLGGSFSGADVYNHIMLNMKTTHANAREKLYVITSGRTTKAQRKSMSLIAKQSDKIWDKRAKRKLASIEKQLQKKNKKLSNATKNRILYGYGSRVWEDLTKNSGYTYSETKFKYKKKRK